MTTRSDAPRGAVAPAYEATVVTEGLPGVMDARRLAHLVGDAYASPDAVLARAAARSTHLVLMESPERDVAAFMFGRLHDVAGARAAYLGPAGIGNAHRGRRLQDRLFGVFVEHVGGADASEPPELYWGVTAHPLMHRAWHSFFGAAAPAEDGTAPRWARHLADALRCELGLSPASTPEEAFVLRRAFTGNGYVEVEARRIAGFSAASSEGPLGRIDHAAGDRLLLVARPPQAVPCRGGSRVSEVSRSRTKTMCSRRT